MTQDTLSLKKQFAAWMVHCLTAATAVIGLFTLYAIHFSYYGIAFILMGVAVFIDSIDGSLARRFDVKKYAARIDGALLDNILDYFNYVITPCYLLLLHPDLLAAGYKEIIVSVVMLASAYQFTQNDAKTDDHFFKGFPSYWNFAVFYMCLFQTSATTNFIALVILSILVFVPVKYVYLSRMDYLTHHSIAKFILMSFSVIFGVVMVIALYQYPHIDTWIPYAVVCYLVIYFLVSLYRTCVPLPPSEKRIEHGN